MMTKIYQTLLVRFHKMYPLHYRVLQKKNSQNNINTSMRNAQMRTYVSQAVLLLTV